MIAPVKKRGRPPKARKVNIWRGKTPATVRGAPRLGFGEVLAGLKGEQGAEQSAFARSLKFLDAFDATISNGRNKSAAITEAAEMVEIDERTAYRAIQRRDMLKAEAAEKVAMWQRLLGGRFVEMPSVTLN